MTDNTSSSNSREHIIQYLTLTGVYPATDELAGTARKDSQVDVRVFFGTIPTGDDVSAVADSSEEWSVDFSGIRDIVSGSSGWVMITDGDGDHTQINWGVPEEPFTLDLEGTWLHTNYLGNSFCIFLDYLGEIGDAHQFDYKRPGLVSLGKYERRYDEEEDKYYLVKTETPNENYPCWVWEIADNNRLLNRCDYDTFYLPRPDECTYCYGDWTSSGNRYSHLTKGEALKGTEDPEIPADVDSDDDGVPNFSLDTSGNEYITDCDNCPDVPNPDQGPCPTDPCDGLGGDPDKDGICTASDNCPNTYNIDLDTNIPPDGLPDAQADTDGDGVGDACDQCPGPDTECDSMEISESPTTPSRPNEPLWVTTCFKCTEDRTVIKPDCYNTIHTLKDGNKILPDRHGDPLAYVLTQENTITIAAGEEFCVTCDLSEKFNPEVVKSGLNGEPKDYTLQATYANKITDDDCLTTPPDESCVELDVVSVTSAEQTITISGAPVESNDATVSFAPSTWITQWAQENSPSVTAEIEAVGEIDPQTVLLNGQVPIDADSDRIVGGKLLVDFNRSQAVESFGTLYPGEFFARVQGKIKNSDDVFSGQAKVVLVNATESNLDIRPYLPQSWPNIIFRCNWGTLPVALISSDDFDATEGDPETFRLAGASVKRRWNGKLAVWKIDINKDDKLDLYFRVKIKELQLSPDDKVALFFGETYDGEPLFGKDNVKVRQRWCRR